ncbi:unnamed protein product [Ambrosiozyma monospora]|uniref:Unnamed protein product n=1 Tax=Ambrosiozyma monospora TaxID=43982 RepID=A0ACB5TQV4_AMBMO|nr:unnamed protein product [Ambrosiozyma monospora]
MASAKPKTAGHANTSNETAEQTAQRVLAAQRKLNNFIKITTLLPEELQEKVFADALQYANLLENHELFTDIIKNSPARYKVDLNVTYGLDDDDEYTCVAWNMEVLSRYIKHLKFFFHKDEDKYVECIEALGVHSIYGIHSGMDKEDWCDFIPSCRDITIEGYVGFEGWAKKYAEKVSALTVKAYPDYLNSILKNKNRFKVLKNIIVEVDRDYGKTNTDYDYFRYLGPLHKDIKDSWHNYTYADALDRLTHQFDSVTLKYNGLLSRITSPQMAKFCNHPKSKAYITCLEAL